MAKIKKRTSINIVVSFLLFLLLLFFFCVFFVCLFSIIRCIMAYKIEVLQVVGSSLTIVNPRVLTAQAIRVARKIHLRGSQEETF